MVGVETIWELHTFTVTRQMIIIAGGESELYCGMAQRGMLSERVGSYAYTCEVRDIESEKGVLFS